MDPDSKSLLFALPMFCALIAAHQLSRDDGMPRNLYPK
jgi:hypothetical protein